MSDMLLYTNIQDTFYTNNLVKVLQVFHIVYLFNQIRTHDLEGYGNGLARISVIVPKELQNG